MFIRYYIELSLPVAKVEQALALVGSPAGWLSAVAGEAQARGDGLLGEVGVGPLVARLRRQVRIQLGERSAGLWTGCCSTGWPRRP